MASPAVGVENNHILKPYTYYLLTDFLFFQTEACYAFNYHGKNLFGTGCSGSMKSTYVLIVSLMIKLYRFCGYSETFWSRTNKEFTMLAAVDQPWSELCNPL
jgi:hypothetical protein